MQVRSYRQPRYVLMSDTATKVCNLITFVNCGAGEYVLHPSTKQVTIRFLLNQKSEYPSVLDRSLPNMIFFSNNKWYYKFPFAVHQ
jgi:hypothetical protein